MVDLPRLGEVRMVEGVPGGVPIPIVPGTGSTVTTEADAVVGIGATVTLTVPPANTLAQTVQNTGTTSGTQIRVREAGGTAGAGILLLQNGVAYYTAAVAALEVEEVAGIATTVAQQFEGS